MSETVRLSRPVDFLAIVPYLLGFHPTMSLVVLAFRDQTLLLGARYDLPADPYESRQLITAYLNLLTRNEADAAVVIGYGPVGLVTPLLEELREPLSATGVTLLHLLRCEGDRYWHHPATGQEQGIPFDLSTSAAAAQAVVAGLSALPDRDTFATCLAPVEGPDRLAVQQATKAARERAERLMASTPRYWYEEGTRALHEAFTRSAAEKPLSPDELAWLGVLLTSIVVRDLAMTLLGTYPAEAHIKLWSEVTRRAEPGYVAAPASLLAFAAYCQGAGTLARIAIDRALADEPGYSFALLQDCALSNGVPPSAIHDMNIAEMGEQIAAQVESCPRAAYPRLSAPAEER